MGEGGNGGGECCGAVAAHGGMAHRLTTFRSRGGAMVPGPYDRLGRWILRDGVELPLPYALA